MDGDDFTFRKRMIDAGSQTFEVDECGEGDRLALCLHGFPEHSFSWRHQLPMLASLGYRAWAPNLRGYGKSSRPVGKAQYTIDKLTGDVAALIDASGCRETVLLAHDWGGVIAWAFAIKGLRPLNKLIVMNLPHPACFQREFRKWHQLRKSWYIFFFQIPRLPEWLLGRDGARRVGDAILNSACDPEKFSDEVLDVYRNNAAQPGALTAMINYYRAALQYPDRELKSLIHNTLETPTMLVWGEEDVALDISLTIGTEEFVSDLTLRLLPGVSHWVQQEAPEQVNAMVKAFLQGQDVPEFSDLRNA